MDLIPKPVSFVNYFIQDKVILITICDVTRYQYDMFWPNFDAIKSIDGAVIKMKLQKLLNGIALIYK